jgi:hypothetical protein
MERPLTTKEAAEAITGETGCPIEEWQVRRLYQFGDLAEPPRLGLKRLIYPSDFPTIIAALRRRGWLYDAQEAAAR